MAICRGSFQGPFTLIRELVRRLVCHEFLIGKHHKVLEIYSKIIIINY